MDSVSSNPAIAAAPLDFASLMRMISEAPLEQRVAFSALLAPPAPAAAADKKPRKPRAKKDAVTPPSAVSTEGRPELPAPLQLVDPDTRCHARVEKKASKGLDDPIYASNGAVFMKGFKTAIYMEDQCQANSIDGSTLCSACSIKKATAIADGLLEKGKGNTKYWHGVIGQTPPSMSPFNGSEKALKIWETEWAQVRTPSSRGTKTTGTSKSSADAPAAAAKKPRAAAKKESKSAAPPAVPAASTTPSGIIPPVVPSETLIVDTDYVIINSGGVGGYMNLKTRVLYGDTLTEALDPIPDLDDIKGRIKDGVDPKKVTIADLLPYTGGEDSADEASDDEDASDESEDDI